MKILLDNTFYIYQFELYFLFSFFLLLCFFVYLGNKKFDQGYFKTVESVSTLLIFTTSILILILIKKYSWPEIYLWGGSYYESYLTLSIKILILIFFVFYIFAYKYYNLYYDFEFLILMYITVFASCLLVNSNDLITFFFCLELQSLSLYVLVASHQTSSFSTEAGLKYFITGSFSSALMLFGISLIYGVTGLYNFEDLHLFSSFFYMCKLNTVNFSFLLGLTFLTVGVFFKVGAVPFHMWMPDTYGGTPWPVVFFISIIPKISLIYVFIIFYYYLFVPLFFFFQLIFVIVSILSIIIGSLGAIYQIKLKRMLTYSMIANNGYFILSLSFGDISGLFVTFFYLIIYFLTMFGLFIAFTFRNRSTGQFIYKLTTLINAFETNPYLAFSFFILLFSLSGIPPLIGFFPKFFLFLFALKHEMYFATIIFLVFSAIGTFYYIRLVKLSYFNTSKNYIFIETLPYSLSLMISNITIFSILFFINPNLIFTVCYNFSLYWYV